MSAGELMDVTPHQLRTVELREAWRGYRQDDVDELLDQVAGTIERLQAQVERLTARLAKVEDEAGLGREADEMLRRTLLLAQRTADAAVSEAQERARRVLSESEVQAHSIVSGAEEEARRVAIAERRRLEGEVRELGRRRDALLADVESLEEAAGDHRRRLREFLEAEISRIDSRPMPTAPVRSGLREEPVDVPQAPEPAEAPPEPLEEAHEDAHEAEGADAGERIDDSVQEADAVQEDAEEDAELDAFAELDAGMADLLPRRRRRRRREADDEADDAFFSELRAAVTDEAPLGPTDDSGEIEVTDDADATRAPDNGAEGEIVLDDVAEVPRHDPRPDAPGDEPVFFDQDAADADDGTHDETRDRDEFDDGIPDGSRLRSVFRRPG